MNALTRSSRAFAPRCSRARAVLSALATAMLLPTVVAAQQNPGSISGVVRDSAGRPIPDALVALDPTGERRLTRTSAAGRFRFERVARGEHELSVAVIGYRSDVRRIVLGEEGLELTIVLQRPVAMVDTMRVEGRRVGIFGTVIARDGFRPLSGAEVQVVGAGRPGRTGSDGRFAFGQVRYGSHVVYVKRPGYLGRMLSVVVPRDSAVELALVLDSLDDNSEKRFAQLLSEFDQRQRWMTGPRAALVSRVELAGREGMSLWDALRYSPSYLLKGLRLDEEACIYVDGLFKSAMTAKDVTVDMIEAVEVYATGADYTGLVTQRHRTPASRFPPGGMCGTAPPRSLSTGIGLINRMTSRAGPRADPARVEAIVIWLKR